MIEPVLLKVLFSLAIECTAIQLRQERLLVNT